MSVLPMGSVVVLNNGSVKVMVVNRGALFNQNGTVGYFDYAGALYPSGMQNSDMVFFNQEDIKEVFFTGYVDETEEKFEAAYDDAVQKSNYPKLKLSE